MSSFAARKGIGGIETRFTGGPATYDKESRCVDAVLSMGSPVKRFYGVEVLKIDPGSVNLDRVRNGGVPVLDSHNQFGISNALGRVQKAWFSNGALMGRLSFNDTREGRKAEGMVSRGEISGISIGYRVDDWEIKDGDGNIINPEKDRVRWDDDELTFTATDWQLLEASLVTVPADATAAIRSYAGRDGALPCLNRRIIRAMISETKALMWLRQASFDGKASSKALALMWARQSIIDRT
jgi:phage head maturation protease